MNLIKNIVVILLVVWGTIEVNATHIRGGDVSYLNVGQDSFLVTLTLWRDCSGADYNSVDSITIKNSCGGESTMSLNIQSREVVGEICDIYQNYSYCNGGFFLGVEKVSYSGLIILPDTCNNWTLSWQNCCWPGSVTNINSNNYTYLSTVVNLGVDPKNSSPHFSASASPVYFSGHICHYNFGAFDPDGDSLVYSLVPGYLNFNTTLNYILGYTYLNPMGSIINLNSQTGQLDFTAASIGDYLVAIRVDEYNRNNGSLKGSMDRNVVMSIQPSSQNQPYFDSLGMVNHGNGSLVNGVLHICIGDTLDIGITMMDSNLSDTLSVIHNIHQILGSSAVVRITGTNPIVVNVNCVVPNRVPSDFSLWFQVNDNACTFNGVASNSFDVHITGGLAATADQTICLGDYVELDARGGNTFTWTSINGAPMDTVSSSSGYNASCLNCANPLVFPSSNTVYQVVSDSIGGCRNMDTVSINVTTSFTVNVSNDTVLCAADSIQLRATVSPLSPNYQYQWSHGNTLNSDTISNPSCFPSGTLDYTVTVHNGTGCFKERTIHVSVRDSVPELFNVPADTTICHGDSIALTADGGSSYYWYAISGPAIDTNSISPNYNMSCRNCSSPTVFPILTTTYLLVSNNTFGCGNYDTVTVNVIPNFSISLSNDTAICGSDSIPLEVNVYPVGLNYSFNWLSSVVLSNDTIINPTAFVSHSATISVNVALDGCMQQDTVEVIRMPEIADLLTIGGDSNICLGESSQLELVFPNSGFAIIHCSLQSFIGYGSDTAIIGDSNLTTTNTSFPSIYGRFYWGVKHQIIYSQPELLAMGLVAGSQIRSIGFDVQSIGSPNNIANLTIRIGCTAQSDFTNPVWQTGLLTVVASHSYFPVLGWNSHDFYSGYIWDGVSNLVVETCSNNTNYSSAATSTTKFSVTVSPSVLFYRGDNSVVCSSPQVGTYSHDRPNTRFIFSKTMDSNSIYTQWMPNSSIDSTSGFMAYVSPIVTTAYNMIVSDTLGVCWDTISKNVNVSSSPFDAGFLYDSLMCVDAGTQSLLPINSGGLFSGAGINSNEEFDPVLAGVGTWDINYFISSPALCANDSTVSITVLGLPDVTIQEEQVCINSPAFILNGTSMGGVWTGTGITDTLAGVFDPTNLAAGDYMVAHTIKFPCFNSDTAIIKIIEPYQFILNDQVVSVCEGESVDLSSNYVLSSDPLQGNGPVVATWYSTGGSIDTAGVFDASGVPLGDYTVTLSVAGSDGTCGTTQTFTVRVNPVDYVAFTDKPSFCINQIVGRLFFNPWLFGAGVTYSQRPLGNLGVNDTLTILPYGQNGEINIATLGKGSWEITLWYENIFGCTGITIDTIYVLDAPTADVTNNGVELTATAGAGYAYQWLDCDNNMNPITGANSATFVPGQKGNYAVQVSAGNCIEISDCYETWTVGISNGMQTEGVSVFPNPMEDKLTIVTPGEEVVRIQVLDNTGKIVASHFTQETALSFSVADLASGVYLIKVEGDNTHFTQKVIKK